MWSHGELPGGGRRWIVALFAALVICSSPVAFVLSSGGHSGTFSTSRRVDLAIGHSEPRSPRLAAAAATPVSTPRSSPSSLAASIAMVAAFVGAAQARRRSSATNIARRVTREQIERLTVDDVPTEWSIKFTLGMARRRQLAARIRQELDECFALICLNRDLGGGKRKSFPKLAAVKEMFPKQVRIHQLKKSIYRAAVKGTDWEPSGLKGQGGCDGHCWFMFIYDENDLKPAVQAMEKANKKFNIDAELAAKKVNLLKVKHWQENKPYGFAFGAMIRDDWEWIPGDQVMKLKDFPTRTELIGRVAGAIQMVTTKIAKGTKQLPQKIAVGTKKIVEKMEDEGKDTVADVVA